MVKYHDALAILILKQIFYNCISIVDKMPEEHGFAQVKGSTAPDLISSSFSSLSIAQYKHSTSRTKSLLFQYLLIKWDYKGFLHLLRDISYDCNWTM